MDYLESEGAAQDKLHIDELGAARRREFLPPGVAGLAQYRRRRMSLPGFPSSSLLVSRSAFGALSGTKFRISRSIASIDF